MSSRPSLRGSSLTPLLDTSGRWLLAQRPPFHRSLSQLTGRAPAAHFHPTRCLHRMQARHPGPPPAAGRSPTQCHGCPSLFSSQLPSYHPSISPPCLYTTGRSASPRGILWIPESSYSLRIYQPRAFPESPLHRHGNGFVRPENKILSFIFKVP